MDRLESDVADLKSGQMQILDYLARIDEEVQSLKKDLAENYEKKSESASWRKKIEGRLENIEKMLAQKTLQGGVLRDE